MPHYLVFGSIRRPMIGGGHFLDWGQDPIGVYSAPDPTTACQTAARDHGNMGTYFAVEGFPWGVELLPVGATQLGRGLSANERLSAHLDRMEDLENRRAQLERQLAEKSQAEAEQAQAESEAAASRAANELRTE